MAHRFYKSIIISMLTVIKSLLLVGTVLIQSVLAEVPEKSAGPVPATLGAIFPQENLVARSLISPATPWLATLFEKEAKTDNLLGLTRKPQLGKAIYKVGDATMTLFVAQYATPDQAAEAATNIEKYFSSLSPKPEINVFSRPEIGTLGFMMKRQGGRVYALRQTGKGLAILPDCPSEEIMKTFLFKLRLGDPTLTFKPVEGVAGKIKPATK